MNEPSSEGAAAGPRWQPVSAVERRVLGVLVEKAKTTPDIYPMSVNAIATGANQKNNRFPQMNLEPDDVQEALDRLRSLGAAGEIQGGGRVPKFRHYLYEWLGVDKVELAVMAELLLRGAQTEGELRGRAARMEPIADVAALRPVLQSLQSKGLILSLTPEGRGHVLTHALYQPRELERVKADYAGGLGAAEPADEPPAPRATSAPSAAPAPAPAPAQHRPPQPAAPRHDEIEALRREMAELRQQVNELRSQMEWLAEKNSA